MQPSNQFSNDKLYLVKSLEVAIHVGLVGLLLYRCFRIGQPFLETIVWGIIIAVAIHPIYERLKSALGGRGRLAAVLITVLALILLLVPAYLLSESLFNTLREYSSQLDSGTLKLPAPPESVKTWPVVGEPIYKSWSLAAGDLGAALAKMAPQLQEFGVKIFATAANAGVGILKFVISIIIAAALLANTSGCSRFAQALAARLAGEQGIKGVDLAGATVRSVAQGVLGVALIQSILAGLDCLVVGVPGAGLWALLVLILAVVQLPTILILGPIIVYVFSITGTVSAVLFAIWSILVGISDAFLKPLLMGRGVDVPMLVIFIGAIGGFMTSGIIGLFVGAIILALGYKLILNWLDVSAPPEQEA